MASRMEAALRVRLTRLWPPREVETLTGLGVAAENVRTAQMLISMHQQLSSDDNRLYGRVLSYISVRRAAADRVAVSV
jgi:hypothetical protein